VTDSINQGVISAAFNVVAGRYYNVSGWIYAVTQSVQMRRNNGFLANVQIFSSGTGAWKQLYVLSQSTTTGVEEIKFISAGGANTFYVDHVSVCPL